MLITLQFEGAGICAATPYGCDLVGVQPGLPMHWVTGSLTVDDTALDQNTDPLTGFYQFGVGSGTGLSVLFGDTTVFFDPFNVYVYNDQYGPWCGGQMLRDLVFIETQGLGFDASFDTCDVSVLQSDALPLSAMTLSGLGPYSTGFGEGLTIHQPDWWVWGNTARIYSSVPEPGTLLLFATGVLLLWRWRR